MDDKQLKKDFDKIKLQIGDYYSKISELEKLLFVTEQKLFLACEHKWNIDYCSYNEHTTWICGKCGLYK